MQTTYRVTPHIKLQAPSQEIATEKLACIRRSRDHLLPWLQWVYFYDENGEQTLAEYTNKKINEFKEGKTYAFDIIADDHFAGCIELLNIAPEDRRCEIGYWLDIENVGQGIMTQCVNKIAAIAFAELNMHRIQLLAAASNRASRAVAERAKFKFEATLRDYQLLEGKFHDIVVYTKMV